MGLCLVHPQYKNGPFIPAASLFFYLKGKKTQPYGVILPGHIFMLLDNIIQIVPTFTIGVSLIAII